MVRIWIAALAVLVFVVSCSRQDSGKGDAAPSGAKPSPEAGPARKAASAPPGASTSETGAKKEASPAPTAPVVTAPTAPSGSILVKRVAVVQEVTKQGVEATVYRVDTDEKRHRLAVTDGRGLANPNQPCASGDLVDVEPATQIYRKVTMQPCTEDVEFVLAKVETTVAMLILGNDLAATDPAKAQAYFATAATRLGPERSAEALLAKNQAHMLAGKALGVAQPTTTQGEEQVFTPEAVAALRNFQQQHGLPPTGQLDPATQSAMAGLHPNELVIQATKIPAVRLDRFRTEAVVPAPAKAATEAKARVTPHFDYKAAITANKAASAPHQ